MKTIRLSQTTGKDGSLSLVIPLGDPERAYDVVLVVEPKPSASTLNGKGWPPGYFDRTYGSIKDETFERPPQGELPETPEWE